MTIPAIAPGEVPLAAAGGLGCGGVGGEVSGAGPGAVKLGTIEFCTVGLVELFVAVVLVAGVFGVSMNVMALVLLPQEVFRKTTLPEMYTNG